MKTRLIVLSLIFTIIVSLIAAGCQSPAPSPTPKPSPSPTPAPAPSLPSIKIGHLRPLTGHQAQTGERMVRGFAFALEQAGYQVAGRKIEVLVEDDGSKPETAVDKARKLVENDKVSMIVGPTAGGSQMAVSAYLDKVGIPMLTTNPSPPGIIMEKHKWTVLTAGPYTLIASSMGRYAYEQLGMKKVNIMTADWAGGHGFLDAYMNTWKKLGGEVIQEQYPPLSTGDYGPYLANLKDADALVAWFDGADAIKFLSQYNDFGMWKRLPIVAAFHGSFFAPYVLAQLPSAASQAIVGRYTPTPYSSLLDIPANKEFVVNFKNKYNFTPEDTESGPYQGALIAMAALKATNGDTTPEKLREAILNVQIEGPEGPIRIDKDKKSVIKNIYICKVDKSGNEYIWVPVYTYKDVPPLGF
jgi:branched-chain amino acid transport system substrate-binding protein